MQDIFKSVLWGATLLFMLFIALVSALYTVLPPGKIYISSQKAAANARLASEVLPPLEYLSKMYLSVPTDRSYTLNSNPDMQMAVKFIDSKIYDCNKTSECSYVFNMGLYDYSKVSKLKHQIERISSPELIEDTNFSVIFSSFFAAVTFILSIYGVYALIRYKRLGSAGEFIFFSLLAPLLGLTISLAFVNHYNTLEKYYTLNDEVVGFALFFIISPFLFYPPAIITARKRGIKIVDVLKLEKIEK